MIDFAAIISPLPEEVFFDQYFGSAPVYVSGIQGRFEWLMEWSSLNRVLSTSRLTFPRLRLAKDGSILPEQQCFGTQFGPNSERLPVLLSSQVTNLLREGAALILDEVEGLHEPVRMLAEALERAFRSKVQANLYAAWRSSPGFDLHWDNHDVLILQVHGKKKWRIHYPTRKYPLEKSRDEIPPSGSPVWEGFLNSGDVLYIPRGWWHVAIPCEEPTVHLTCGVTNSTGQRLLWWLADRLTKEECVRMDIPRFKGPAVQLEHAAKLRQLVAEALAGDFVAEYFEYLDVMAEPRPLFTLPWSASPDILPPSPEASIVVRNPRGLAVWNRPDVGEVEVPSRGKSIRFHAATEPLFQCLATEAPIPVAQFQQRFAGSFSQEELQTFLSELVTRDLIAVVAP